MNIDKIKNSYFDYFEYIKSNFPDLDTKQVERLIENIVCTNTINEYSDVLNWYEKIKNNNENVLSEINLNEINNWKLSEKNIKHSTGKFFQVIGIRTLGGKDREIGSGWDQPFLKEVNNDGGVLGLLRTYINDLPHYLVQAKFEPGNYGKIQLSPTLQATFSNINKDHGGHLPYYYEFFEDWESSNSDYLFNSWLAEDGGRFYLKRNRGVVKQVEFNDIQIQNETFNWVSLFQIKKLLDLDAIVNPHLARLIFL